MKKLIKFLLPYDILLLIKNLKKDFKKLKTIYFKKSKFSNSAIDDKLQKYLNYKNGFYIELGANDGVFSSNTFYLQRNFNWKGILIEPSQHLYFKCKDNRGNKNIVLNYACVSKDYKHKYVEMIYSGAMTIAKDLDNDIKDIKKHAKEGESFLDSSQKVFEFCSLAKTLNDILVENGIQKTIDFLSLDVEGAELEVLNGINFKMYCIKNILIESRDFEKTNSYLTKRGYLFKESMSEHDYFFQKICDK